MSNGISPTTYGDIVIPWVWEPQYWFLNFLIRLYCTIMPLRRESSTEIILFHGVICFATYEGLNCRLERTCGQQLLSAYSQLYGHRKLPTWAFKCSLRICLLIGSNDTCSPTPSTIFSMPLCTFRSHCLVCWPVTFRPWSAAPFAMSSFMEYFHEFGENLFIFRYGGSLEYFCVQNAAHGSQQELLCWQFGIVILQHSLKRSIDTSPLVSVFMMSNKGS